MRAILFLLTNLRLASVEFKEKDMKLLRTYKHDTTTWFVYSCLFQYVELNKICISKGLTQHTIDYWMRIVPSISMRTKYEDN